MAKNFLAAALTAAVVALTLAGCSAPAAPPGGSAAAGTEAHEGVLVSQELGADDIVGTWITGESYDTAIKPFLAIAADGTWSSSDGCNGVAGTWKLGADGALNATAGPQTLMYCPGVSLSSVIAGATHVALDGGSLVFSGDPSDPGSTMLQPGDASYGPSAPLVGHWAATDGSSTYIDFAADGTFGGKDLCNGIGGTWAGTGLVQFSNVAATAMACVGADGLGSFALGFVNGNTMTLTDADGNHVGELVASATAQEN